MASISIRAMLALSAAAGALALPAVAVAQEVPDAEPAARDDIVVTAQKREENLQDVPVSISVVGGEEIAESGGSQLTDYAPYVPGFTVTNAGTPGQAMIALRGISPLGSAGSVGVYLDDAPVGSSTPFNNGATFAIDLLPYELERVEVLRGPQGTLYGASSIGGLVKYVTVAPDLDGVSGRVGGELFAIAHGSDVGYAAQGLVNVPLVAGKLAVTGSLAYRRTPGWVDTVAGVKDQNSYEQTSARASLLWQATDALAFRASGIWQTVDAEGRGIIVKTPTGATIGNGYSNFNTSPEPFTNDFQYYSAGFDYELGSFATLSATATYSEMTTDNDLDISFLYGPLLGGIHTPIEYSLTLEKYTGEVRLASPTGATFEWLLGAFYTSEDATHEQLLKAQDPIGTPVPGLDPLALIQLPSTYEEYAVFGNATWSITDQFKLSGGVRYAWNEQNYAQIFGGVLLPPISAPGTSTDGVFTFSVSPQFHINDDAMVYARVATGYRPGGPNVVLPGATTVPPEFAADTLTNYELGFKADVARQLTVDIAAFLMDWNDIQLAVPAGGGLSGIGNGGTARSQGVEVALMWRPVPGLSLGASAAFTDSTLTQDAPPIQGRDGDRLPRIPEFSGALTADYEFDLGANARAKLGAGLRHTGNRYSEVESDPNAQLLPAYTAIDLDASVTFDSIRVRAYVRNLTDSDAPLTRTLQSDAGGTVSHLQVVPIQPRTIGVAADFSF